MAQRIVGLDIGTSALRAVELVVDNGSRPVLEAYGQVGLPPGAMVEGEVRDRSQVTAALRRLWREGGFRSTRVHLGVAGLRAITREMELPPVPPDELDSVVLLQADDIIPFPMERTSIASTVVARTVDSDGLPLIRVLVAAAHRDLIDGVVAAVEEAGLEPVNIDLDTAALSRAFALPGGADDPEVVVSVGAGLTMVVVHHGGALQFVRTIDLGGDAVTNALSSRLDLPFVDAELLKRSLGERGHHDATALAAAGAVVNELASEVHSSIRYYDSLPGRVPPSRVLMTGGGIRTVGLLAKVQDGIDIPVLEASPLSFVDVSRLGMSPGEAAAINQTAAIPIGLALDGPSRTHFDLMPQEVIVKHAERHVRRLLTLVAVGIVILLAVGTAWRVLSVRSAEHGVGTLQSLVTTINTVEIPRYDSAVKLADEVTALQTQLAPLVSHEVDWLVVLNQLGQYMPASAVLSGLDLTAATYPGTTTAPASTPSSTAPSKGAAVTTIGTGTSTVMVGDLTEVTQFGLTMAKSPALSSVVPSGAVSAGSSGSGTGTSTPQVSFPVSFDITTAAHSQRLSLFTQPIP
jgi:type IV pilus assembly protein PilM